MVKRRRHTSRRKSRKSRRSSRKTNKGEAQCYGVVRQNTMCPMKYDATAKAAVALARKLARNEPINWGAYEKRGQDFINCAQQLQEKGNTCLTNRDLLRSQYSNLFGGGGGGANFTYRFNLDSNEGGKKKPMTFDEYKIEKLLNEIYAEKKKAIVEELKKKIKKKADRIVSTKKTELEDMKTGLTPYIQNYLEIPNRKHSKDDFFKAMFDSVQSQNNSGPYANQYNKLFEYGSQHFSIPE